MVPAAFHATPRAVRALNIAAVGLALSAAAGALLEVLTDWWDGIVLPSTLIVGMIWAWTLRFPNTVGTSRLRWGWLLSIPLAALNGALTGGLFEVYQWAAYRGSAGLWELPERFVMGAVGGVIEVWFLWGSSLLLMLVCFGPPIAFSQRLAQSGRSGEERGELVIALFCTLVGVASLLGISLVHPANPMDFSRAGNWLVAVSDIIAGSSVILLLVARERGRNAFVKRAEAGELSGFRVDPSPEGRVLVRVGCRGEGYRVADFTEEVFLLDEEGRATQARALESTLPNTRAP